MKLEAHYNGDIGWMVHELAWNRHEIEVALLWTHLMKGVLRKCLNLKVDLLYLIVSSNIKIINNK